MDYQKICLQDLMKKAVIGTFFKDFEKAKQFARKKCLDTKKEYVAKKCSDGWLVYLNP